MKDILLELQRVLSNGEDEKGGYGTTDDSHIGDTRQEELRTLCRTDRESLEALLGPFNGPSVADGIDFTADEAEKILERTLTAYVQRIVANNIAACIKAKKRHLLRYTEYDDNVLGSLKVTFDESVKNYYDEILLSEATVHNAKLAYMLSELCDYDILFLNLCYTVELTDTEIGKFLGTSRQGVNRYRLELLEYLRGISKNCWYNHTMRKYEGDCTDDKLRKRRTRYGNSRKIARGKYKVEICSEGAWTTIRVTSPAGEYVSQEEGKCSSTGKLFKPSTTIVLSGGKYVYGGPQETIKPTREDTLADTKPCKRWRPICNTICPYEIQKSHKKSRK